MTRILKSETNKSQNSEDLSSKLSISKRSKIIKKTDKKAIEIKNQDNQQNEGWNISDVLSNIFSYTDHKDLVEFNTVCKKWNNLTNPIIHKTIKLIRNWDIIEQAYDNKLNYPALFEAEIAKCIFNNIQHASYVKEFKYNYKLAPQTAISVFENFRFISNLSIESCDMSQEQFIDMIRPLTQLQELTLNKFCIRKVNNKGIYRNMVQLPSTLKKLNLLNVRLEDNPELFIQTVNSHNSLVEFISNPSSNSKFLEPFYNPYPSLVSFEYVDHYLKNLQLLIKMFEQNHQIASLKLKLNSLNSELTASISNYLNNLEELDLFECLDQQNYTDPYLRFSESTKIKKLNLTWGSVRNCSLESILPNCPQLEDLVLNQRYYYNHAASELLINLSRPFKIKKLTINSSHFSETVLESLLFSCPYIGELAIHLPEYWKDTVKSIYENCANLQILDISSTFQLYLSEKDPFSQEFYETELFTTKSKFKSTLTHLTLYRFNALSSKAEYFKNFKNLKSIKYLRQNYRNYPNDKNIEIDLSLWPGYELTYKDNFNNYDVEFKRL